MVLSAIEIYAGYIFAGEKPVEIYFCVYPNLPIYIFSCPDIVSEYIRPGRYSDIRRIWGIYRLYPPTNTADFPVGIYRNMSIGCMSLSGYIFKSVFYMRIYFCLYLQEIIIFRALRNTHTAGLFSCHKGGAAPCQGCRRNPVPTPAVQG